MEALSLKIAMEPVKDKSDQSFQSTVETMVETRFPDVTRFSSDRETALRQTKWQNKMKSRFGITWNFFYVRSKCYKAERMIRLAKTAISLMEKMLKRENKKWIDLPQKFCNYWNARRIPGTSYTPNTIDKSNYMDFLAKLLKTKDPSVVFTTSFIQASSLPPSARRKIWRYRKGQLVNIPRELDLSLTKEEKRAKKSVYGSWSPKLYKVERLFLKRTRNNYLVPCYKLNVEQGDDILFYNNDLIPALYAYKKR